jgi:single-strand DNA-binding protein
MASFNKSILVGNIVRNPELRYTPGSNLAVARTAIAVNRRYKDKEEVMFIDLVFFGKLAETVESYATKGTPLLIEGRLSQNTWEQDGQKRSKHEIIVENFQLLGGRRDKSEDTPEGAGFSAPADHAEDDDIPF